MLICLTGMPGIGKTTIIMKLVEYLKKQNLNMEGFFTQEIRDPHGNREGFDVVTIKNKTRGVLARKYAVRSPFKLGSYYVDVDQFERVVLQVFVNPQKLMILDEVGKMELFSEKFQAAVDKLIRCPNITVIATVPLKSNDQFIHKLKRNSKKLFYVNNNNRDNQLDELLKELGMK